MTAQELTIAQITTHIAAHASEQDLDRLNEVLRKRRKTLAQIAAAAVTVDATVTVVNLRPADYKGKRGTVTAISGDTATIRFDAASTNELRFARSSKIHVPDDVTEWTASGFPLVCLRVD